MSLASFAQKYCNNRLDRLSKFLISILFLNGSVSNAMQVGFLGSADSWYYSDLLRAATRDEHLVAIDFTELAGRSGSCLERDSLPGNESTTGSSVARWFAAGVDLATLDALLVRTMPPDLSNRSCFAWISWVVTNGKVDWW